MLVFIMIKTKGYCHVTSLQKLHNKRVNLTAGSTPAFCQVQWPPQVTLGVSCPSVNPAEQRNSLVKKGSLMSEQQLRSLMPQDIWSLPQRTSKLPTQDARSLNCLMVLLLPGASVLVTRCPRCFLCVLVVRLTEFRVSSMSATVCVPGVRGNSIKTSQQITGAEPQKRRSAQFKRWAA